MNALIIQHDVAKAILRALIDGVGGTFSAALLRRPPFVLELYDDALKYLQSVSQCTTHTDASKSWKRNSEWFGKSVGLMETMAADALFRVVYDNWRNGCESLKERISLVLEKMDKDNYNSYNAPAIDFVHCYIRASEKAFKLAFKEMQAAKQAKAKQAAERAAKPTNNKKYHKGKNHG